MRPIRHASIFRVPLAIYNTCDAAPRPAVIPRNPPLIQSCLLVLAVVTIEPVATQYHFALIFYIKLERLTLSDFLQGTSDESN